MTDPFVQQVSSELSDLRAPLAPASPGEDEYVDYGDGIRTPPGEGSTVEEEYVDYGDGIRTPPGEGSTVEEEYVDYGDGIRTPPAPSAPETADLADLAGPVIRIADGTTLHTAPAGAAAGADQGGDLSFGAGEVAAPLQIPAPDIDAGSAGYGAGDPGASEPTGTEDLAGDLTGDVAAELTSDVAADLPVDWAPDPLATDTADAFTDAADGGDAVGDSLPDDDGAGDDLFGGGEADLALG